jgi:C1A family cysteine protease
MWFLNQIFLDWILRSGENGVPAMTSYQYYGFRTKCRTDLTKIPMNIKAVVQNYTAGNENMMKEIVANVGPVAAVIHVTSLFQPYRSGVFYDTTCNSNCTNVNHAVVIVGYGRNTTTKLDYWIVKNSWVGDEL